MAGAGRSRDIADEDEDVEDMDIGRIVREVEAIPADEPDMAPLDEPDREPQPEAVPAEPA